MQPRQGKSLGRPTASRPAPKEAAQSRSSSGDGRQQGWERRRAQRRQRNLILAIVGAVVVIVAAFIVVKSFVGNGPSGASALPPGVEQQVTDVSVQEMVAAAEVVPATGATSNGITPPGAINGPPALGGAHPTVLYIGAEYCPYCAAERWPLVMALSKFGSFTGLEQTTSSSTDTNANTPTFSFVNAKFASPYLTFTSREQEDRLEKPLQALTSQQNQLVKTYDNPPYVPSSAAGSIPFILLGDRFVVSGAEYDASSIAGTSMANAATILTAAQTPSATASGNAALSQDAKAVGGHLLGALCAITGNKPKLCASVPANLKPSGSTTGGQSSKGS